MTPDLTPVLVLCLFLQTHGSKKAGQTVTRKGSEQQLAEPAVLEQQAKDMKRLLAKAEHTIGKLQEKLADQKKLVRELQAQAKHETNLAAECEELKSEIADMKGEIRELTRTNREQVEKLEAARMELMKAKATARIPKPTGTAARARPRDYLQPTLP